MSKRIAICMATYEPNPDLLRVQLDSIRAQSGVEWRCFISDDASGPEAFAALEAEIAGDERFVLSRSERRLGFYRNFERALGMVPDDYDLVALSDQDDSWYPDKLARLSAALGSANMVYSDQRVVSTSGEVIASTYWTDRRNNHTDLLSLLIANTVTGAASLFRRDLLDLALPFPEVPGEQYHDHWLALVALATGDLAYLDEPLYDYVQHSGAVLGHDEANAGDRARAIRERLDPRQARATISGWASAYFDVYLRLQALAQTLLGRCGSMSARKRRTLERFVATNKDPFGPVRLWLRSLRPLVGRDETFGVERVLARAVLYRHLAAVKRRLPEAAVERLSESNDESKGQPAGVAEADRMKHKIQPLAVSVESSAPVRLNLLIPSIDLQHFFGGYIAKFNLARKLAARGHRVRIVTVDPNHAVPGDWKDRIEEYSGLAGVFDEIEVEFGRDGPGVLEVNPGDRFIATTWWTAHIADQLVRFTEASRFLYLIQEYEPLTVPPGSWAALAQESYEFPHHALFSTAILREYFRDRGYGIYADGGPGDEGGTDFQNAITPVDPPAAGEIVGRDRRSLIFYGRPESHAARNMFELGLLALRAAAHEGVFGPEWTIHGIGSVGSRGSIPLSRSHRLELGTRKSQDDYGRMLAGHDVGLALMYAPHPSLVPIEMASAGLVTVTNSFETKTAAAMEAISGNIRAVDPSVPRLVGALREAVAAAADGEARVGRSAVEWSRSWDESFDQNTLERVDGLLASC